MSTQILIKRSTTTGAVPTTSDIATGELAINTTDKRIFTNNEGTIVELGTTPTTQTVTGNASVGGTFDVVGAVTVGNLTADGTVDLTAATVTIPAPTADTHPATKKYVDDEVNAILDGAPAALDTLNEIAAAINDDANLYTTLTTSIATKLSLAGGTMTGSIDMGANSVTTSADPATDNTLTRKSYVDGLYQSTVDAEVSAANALASEQAAATSASNAAASATTASTQASASASSATNAASSATAAASSATSAANSATASATSATQSAASATQAQALVDSIESFYLGAEASAPTVDDNGDPLQAGDWYFNTTDNATYIYNGSSWQSVSPDLVSDLTPQLGGNLDTNGNDINFGDNDKAIFGAGSDLQIYHDGSNSYITDNGTGNTVIETNGAQISLTGGGEYMLRAQKDGATRLYYDGSEKIATTSTGIDVTGTATMDGLTVSGDGSIAEFIGSNAVNVDLMESDTTDVNTRFRQTAGQLLVQTVVDAQNSGKSRINVDHSTGDISFYEDTGTTAKFYWDASAESLGIGTSSPASQLEMSKAGGTSLRIKDATSGYTAVIEQNSSTDTQIRANNPIVLYTTGSERMRIDSSGNVGIGNSAPYDVRVHITGDNNDEDPVLGSPTGALLVSNTDTAYGLQMGVSSGGEGWIQQGRVDGNATPYNLNLQPVGGNVGIGTSSPSANHVQSLYSHKATAGEVIGTKMTNANNVDFEIGVAGASYTGTGSPNAALLNVIDAQPLILGTSNTERARIDSSGNLLVGTTTPNGTGITLNTSDYIYAARYQDEPMYLDRKGNDGNIAVFRKDGTTVGSIGVSASDNLYFTGGTGSTKGIYLNDNTLGPAATGGAGAVSDATTNLGAPPARFKDLYLSGGVYLGGTGSANHLDDYESGTFTPTSPHLTITNNSTCRYIKVGNLVYATYDITFPSSASGTGVVVNTPFVAQDYGSGMMGWKNMSTDIGIHIYSTGIGFRKMDTSNDATYNDVSTARFIFTAIFSVA